MKQIICRTNKRKCLEDELHGIEEKYKKASIEITKILDPKTKNKYS